jgi:hypothetical protein
VRESHLQVVWIVFLFCDFGVFLPDLSSVSLEEFFFIPSVGLGARMSLIIYLEPWSESVAVAHSIWRISLISP